MCSLRALAVIFRVARWYHLAIAGTDAQARRESICLEQRFSDHAPLRSYFDLCLDLELLKALGD